VENPAIVGPALGAVIAGVFLLLGHRVLTYWTAREGRKTTLRATQDAAAVAKVTTDEQDRARISADWQWIIGNLRTDVSVLTSQQATMREELNKLSIELDSVRRENGQLTYDNGLLRQQVSVETGKREHLERRVDQLTAINIVLVRELSRHGIAVPALAKEQAAP
jgi:chromosome segregation ATPase